MTDSNAVGANVSIALLHYPVYDKNRQVVASAVTNLDIHDIARAARTFGLFRYYVVTPVSGQREMVERISRHWREGWGATYNPKRKAALELLAVTSSLDDAIHELAEEFGKPVKIVMTGAGNHPRSVTCADFAALIKDSGQPYLLVFGTGWGLTEEVFAWADIILEPVKGPGVYNHLSVRSAVAIILDRLLGKR